MFDIANETATVRNDGTINSEVTLTLNVRACVSLEKDNQAPYSPRKTTAIRSARSAEEKLVPSSSANLAGLQRNAEAISATQPNVEGKIGKSIDLFTYSRGPQNRRVNRHLPVPLQVSLSAEKFASLQQNTKSTSASRRENMKWKIEKTTQPVVSGTSELRGTYSSSCPCGSDIICLE
jgi:hypothetical protein